MTGSKSTGLMRANDRNQVQATEASRSACDTPVT